MPYRLRARPVARRMFLAAAAAAGGSLTAGLGARKADAADPTSIEKKDRMATLSQDALYTTSVKATSLTGEAADRVVIRELIDTWAHCADRRLAEKQAELFTSDGKYTIYDGDPATHAPIGTRQGRSQIIEALGALDKFVATTHFNGQSVIVVQGEQAVGESYCLAHQLLEKDGARTLQLLSIRYLDDFQRIGDRWLFVERKLVIDWSDTRSSVT